MLMNPIGGLRRRGGAAAGGEAPHGSEDALQADDRQLIGGSETIADAATGPEAIPPKMREHCKRWPRSTNSGGSRRDGLAVVPEELFIRAS